MKGFLFLAVLGGIGYALYTYYGHDISILDENNPSSIHNAPQIFQEKADKLEEKLNKRVDEMRGDINEAEVDGY
jgi:hypothetical protein